MASPIPQSSAKWELAEKLQLNIDTVPEDRALYAAMKVIIRPRHAERVLK